MKTSNKSRSSFLFLLSFFKRNNPQSPYSTNNNLSQNILKLLRAANLQVETLLLSFYLHMFISVLKRILNWVFWPVGCINVCRERTLLNYYFQNEYFSSTLLRKEGINECLKKDDVTCQLRSTTIQYQRTTNNESLTCKRKKKTCGYKYWWILKQNCAN